MHIPIIENVLKLNDEIATLNRAALQEAGVFTIDLIGGPGCGKTALLERTLAQLAGQCRVGILVGDLATARDAQRLAAHTDHVVQINTGKACHLDANQVRQAMANIDLNAIEILIIENVGNLICPVGFDLGQDAKVGMFSVTEGDDKAAKHPHLVMAADVLVLNKIDLLGSVPFQRDQFLKDVRSLRSDIRLVEVSAATGDTDTWLAWLRDAVAQVA